MIALVQRVSRAAVSVEGEEIASIGPGILALVAVEKGDADENARRLAELLAVSQFTLAADTAAGLRPSFSSAAPPEEGRRLFDLFVKLAAQEVPVKTGRFGADMKVSLVNDGPVTFWLRIRGQDRNSGEA